MHRDLDVCPSHPLSISCHFTVGVLVSQARVLPDYPLSSVQIIMCHSGVPYNCFTGVLQLSLWAKKNYLLTFSELSAPCTPVLCSPCICVQVCVYVFINTTHFCLTLCWRWRRRCFTGYMCLSVCPSCESVPLLSR